MIYRIAPQVPLIDVDEPTSEQSSQELTSEKQGDHLIHLRANLAIGFAILSVALFAEEVVGSLVAPFIEVFLLKEI